MASNRCFNTLNKTIVNASDLTQSKRQTTIYKDLANNTISAAGPDPIKNNGSTYNDNFIVKGGNTDNACLVAAKNYDLLLDLTKGKRFANPVLNGASAAKYEMWAGNVLEANYNTNSSGVSVIPVRGMIPLGTDGDVQDGSDNTIMFPSPCVNDCSWNASTYPGYTVDPNQNLFYASCDDSNKVVPYIRTVCDISFRNTNYYWSAAAAQPLNGISYPAPLRIGFQDTDSTTTIATKFGPLATGGTGISGEWCAGKHAIN